MKTKSVLGAVLLFCLFAAGALAQGQGNGNANAKGQLANHPAVGSWFGKAEQVCVSQENPSCFKAALFMTPTLTADGKFLGDDSLVFFPPFGPHTPAYGAWQPVNHTDIVADYLTMSLASPGDASNPPLINAFRFRWNARFTGKETMTGYVNVYGYPPIPLTWEGGGETTSFPELSPEALAPTVPPTVFFTDPQKCDLPACPLVFKFTIKRISPPEP